MSWPTQTWTADGYKDFKTPGGSGIPEGFPDDWKDHESSIDNSTYWDVIENPLYELAAEASGIDWDQFVADSFAELGTDQSTIIPAEGWLQDEVTGLWGREGVPGSGEIGLDLWGNMKEHPPYEFSDTNVTADPRDSDDFAEQMIGHAQMDEDGIHWGFDRDEFGSIAEDLDTMHEYLTKTIKTHSLQDAPIIRRGPEGSDYGIDGDIWEHYGIGKEPLPPKEMDVNYDFNLIVAKPSSKSYATPEGYPTLDTSTESIPYEDTHYARWSKAKTEEAKTAHAEAADT